MLNRFKSEHQQVKEMLSAYLDGELSPKEQARVEKHLAQCADCAQNLHTLRQTVALLRGLPLVAVPRSFAIRPAEVARRPSVVPARRTYAYLRAATVLATVLLAVVLAGDAFLTGLAPYLTPARAPAVIEREVPMEKAVVETVVVEKEVMVEKEAVEVTPSPIPAEKKEELVVTQKPLPTEGRMAAAPSATPKMEALAEAPLPPGEERIGATPTPGEAVIAAEIALTPTAMPTAVVEALPPTPIPHEPAVRAAVQPSRLVLLRIIEASLLLLVLALAVATLIAKRRQVAR
jgi:hypothetical protein